MRNFWENIRKNGGEINFGVVGFSGGFTLGGKRISLVWMYNNRFAIISKKMKINMDIDDEDYNLYIEDLKKSTIIYDTTIVGNRVEVLFESIDLNDFKILCIATINLLKKLQSRKNEN